MMRRPTVALLIYAATGGGIMALAATAVAQAAPTPSPSGSHDAVLSLLGPSASGIVGALVVAVYNQVTGLMKTFSDRMDRLEAANKGIQQHLKSRPCMLDEPCEFQDGDEELPKPHKRGRS